MISRVTPFKLQESADTSYYQPLKIKPIAKSPINYEAELDPLLVWIQKSVEEMLSTDLRSRFYNMENQEKLPFLFQELFAQIPILHFATPNSAPGVLKINLLCHSNHTQGVGRFFSDAISQGILPGNPVVINSASSLNFCFIKDPFKHYYFQQLICQIEQEKDLRFIQEHLPSFLNELRLTVSTARHLRMMVTAHHFSQKQQLILIQNHVENLIDHPLNKIKPSLFDRMHPLFVQASAEEKLKRIQEQMISFNEQKAHFFDTNLFEEIQHNITLMSNSFIAKRHRSHLVRVLTSLCLFRRVLKQQVHSRLYHRHVMTRTFRLKTNHASTSRSWIGVLVGMNVLSENELFDQKHLFQAIQHSLHSPIRSIEGSYIAHQVENPHLRFFYLEVEKQNLHPFNKEEVKKIKTSLIQELKSSIENVIQSVFMPRNEEDVMRSILQLNQELKYIKDLPQVVINFDRQKEGTLLFTVILARVLRPQDLSLAKFLSKQETLLRFQDFDVKAIGYLRNKYRKEASVFTAVVDKQQFMRKDFSIDLFKARQFISSELSKLLGEIRDFNGGILSKQQELFHELKQLLAEHSLLNEFLLETFFYSITPTLMQTVLSSSVLKTLYLMLLEGIEHNFKRHLFFLKSHWNLGHLLILAASPSPFIKEALDQAILSLNIPVSDICVTHVKAYDICAVGYIYRCEDIEEGSALYNTFKHTLTQWEKNSALSR